MTTSFESKIAKLMNSGREVKFFDHADGTTNLGGFATNNGQWDGCNIDTTTTSCLFAPTTGSGKNNRVGNTVFVVGLHLKGTLTVSQNAAWSAFGEVLGNVARIIVYRDGQVNATVNNSNQLIGPGAGLGFGGSFITYFQIPTSLERFEILKDYSIDISCLPLQTYNGTGTGGGTNLLYGREVRDVEFYIDFSRDPIRFDFNTNNAGNVFDLVRNSLQICGNAALPYSNATPYVGEIDFHYVTRTYFYD